MSFTSIPNQPILFNSVLPEGCEGCNSDYTQLVDLNDQLFFQFNADACQFTRFYQAYTPFNITYSAGTLTFPPGFNQTATPWLVYRKFINAIWYRLTITVSPDSVGGFDVVLNNSGNVERIDTVGTHTIYLYINNITANTYLWYVNVWFKVYQNNSFSGSITVNEFVPIGNFINTPTFVGLVDPVTLATQHILNPYQTAFNEYTTIAFKISDYDIDPGCYRIGVADPCTNTCSQYYLFNPYFNNLQDPKWTSAPVFGSSLWNLSLTGGASITLGPGFITDLVSDSELCEGKEYFIRFIVGTLSSIQIIFQVDGVQYGPTITAAGTYTFNCTPTSTGPVSIRAFDITSGGSATVTFLDITAYKEHATYDLYSDVISIGDYSDDCRFFKLEGCNGENQFGFQFGGSSFLPGIRLEGRRFRAQYDADVDLFRYASGKAITSYADIRKRISYYFGRLPEYVLDFLSILVYFDNFYINGEVYSPADNSFPDVEYNDADDLGNVILELYKKNVKVRKSVCLGVDADCLPSVLDNNDEPFILTQDNQRITTENLINLYQE